MTDLKGKMGNGRRPKKANTSSRSGKAASKTKPKPKAEETTEPTITERKCASCGRKVKLVDGRYEMHRRPRGGEGDGWCIASNLKAKRQ